MELTTDDSNNQLICVGDKTKNNKIKFVRTKSKSKKLKILISLVR